jgi:hypothetical protein
MADDWKVTGIRQETQLSENNDTFRPVFKVGYQVTNGAAQGTTGHVVIPASEYNHEVVNNAIQRIVEQHQRISNL